MKNKIHYKFNKVISPETKYMRLMEAIDEANNSFLRTRRKCEALNSKGVRQSS